MSTDTTPRSARDEPPRGREAAGTTTAARLANFGGREATDEREGAGEERRGGGPDSGLKFLGGRSFPLIPFDFPWF